MIPPVPVETLPEWVQEAMKTRPHTFKVGDQVYGVLYAERDGTVLTVNNEEGSMTVGHHWDQEKNRYDLTTRSSTMWYIKYPEESSK